MPLPSHLDTVANRRLRDQVYDALEGWIVDGTLRPGERMRDQEISERLGISRTPVREALLRLEEEGLIETAAGRWTRVAPVARDQVERVYTLLWILEPLAIKLAHSRLTVRHIDEMANINQQLASFVELDDAVRASAADYDFHQVFIAETKHPELIRILRNLKRQMRRLEVTYFGGRLVADRSVAEHSQIIQALRDDDGGDRAADLVGLHWHESLLRMQTHLEAWADHPKGLNHLSVSSARRS